ncbi:S8 family serine peptidase (plasmid) [Natrialbaceae archaeon A-CW2]
MRLTRRQYLKTTASAVTLATIAPADSPGLMWWSEPDNAINHSGGRLSWVVSTDDLGALEEEVGRYDDVRWLDARVHEPTKTVTLVASPGDMGARQRDRLSGSGLADLSFVESIEVNRSLPMVRPLEPEGSSAWSSPGRTLQTHLEIFGDGALSRSGVAFDRDMDGGDLSDVRQITGETETNVTTSGLTIAVIDTGVNDGDAIAESRLLTTSKDFTDGDETGTDAAADGDGHGSWVASCMAADTGDRYAGYLPDADILAIKALSDDGSGSIDDIANAIKYAADQGADVICLSLGSPQFSPAIEGALEYATQEGAIPVAAAGNDRQLSRWLAYPASSQWTIAVGATTVAAPDEAQSAYFSNVGPHNGISDMSDGETLDAMPTVGAPGCEITAQVPRRTGSDTERALTGTSMAAPVVAGIVGLRLADGGSTDFDDIQTDLEATSRPIPNAAEEEVGAGMANADALLSGTEPEEPQAEVMTDEAATRGVAYSQLSGSRYARALTSVQQTLGF